MLSVLIPTFNNEKFLPIAIASALALKNLGEIVIIDDCSTDDTASLVKKLQIQSNKIKYYRNNTNLGVGFSFIKAIEISKFPYVLMCNGDDFFIPENIDQLYNFLIKNKLDLAYGKMAIQKEKKIYKYKHPGYQEEDYVNNRDEFRDLLIYDMYMPSFGTIIKTDELKEFYNKDYMSNLDKMYGERFKAHDYDLFLNLSKKKKKIGFLNKFVCVWKPEDNSQSGNNYFQTGIAVKESAFLFERYFDKNCNLDLSDLKRIRERIIGKLNSASRLNSEQKRKITEDYPFIFSKC